MRPKRKSLLLDASLDERFREDYDSDWGRQSHEYDGDHRLGNQRSAYSSLDDVDLKTAAVANNQALLYNSTKELWAPATIATSLAGALAHTGRSDSWIASTRLSTTANASLVGACYVTPIWLNNTAAVDRWLITVQVAGGAGASCTGVIYASGTDGYPTTLQANLGTISATTTGQKNTTISPAVTLTKGMYWIGFLNYGGASQPSYLRCSLFYNWPWNTLGDASTYGRPDYTPTGTTGGATTFFTVDCFGLADFDDSGRTTPPDPFGAYTGRVNLPATTDNGTIDTPFMTALHVQ